MSVQQFKDIHRTVRIRVRNCRKRNSYPSEILLRKLYLGDQFDAQDIYVMKNLKITHVINVTSEMPNFFEKEGNHER